MRDHRKVYPFTVYSGLFFPPEARQAAIIGQMEMQFQCFAGNEFVLVKNRLESRAQQFARSLRLRRIRIINVAGKSDGVRLPHNRHVGEERRYSDGVPRVAADISVDAPDTFIGGVGSICLNHFGKQAVNDEITDKGETKKQAKLRNGEFPDQFHRTELSSGLQKGKAFENRRVSPLQCFLHDNRLNLLLPSLQK